MSESVLQAAMERLAQLLEAAQVEKSRAIVEFAKATKLRIDSLLEAESNAKRGNQPYGSLPGERKILIEMIRLRIGRYETTGDLVGWQQVANELNRKGYRARCGKLWERSTVREIIKHAANVLYTQLYKFRKMSDVKLLAHQSDVLDYIKRFRLESSRDDNR
jgi:hypothetical protein